MQELNQGEYYDEQNPEDEMGMDYVDESNENTNSEITTIYGIPKQFFFLGLAVVAIIILVVVLFVFKGSSDKQVSEEDIVYPEENVLLDTNPVVLNTECYDASGNLLGVCDNITEGFSIYREDGTTVGFVSTTGTIEFFDNVGTSLGFYIPYVEDTVTNSAEEESDIITTNPDNKLLRQMGYTGDEIELAQSTNISTETLVEAAKKLRDNEAKEALKRMSDKASDEFKYIIDNSIFGLPEIHFDSFNPDLPQSRKYNGTYVVNADYTKLPTYGNQLWIKVKIANSTYVMYDVTPDRWETLPDTGNIVMQVTYTMYGTDTINMYVTGLTEIDTTDITTNLEDSAVDLSEILEESANTLEESTESEETDSTSNWW